MKYTRCNDCLKKAKMFLLCLNKKTNKYELKAYCNFHPDQDEFGDQYCRDWEDLDIWEPSEFTERIEITEEQYKRAIQKNIY